MRFLKLLAVSTALFLTACHTTVYVPQAVNAPALKEKHEFKGNIGPNNLQAAFAVSENIAVMASGQYVYRNAFYGNEGGDNDNDVFDRNVRGGAFEGGVGYFKAFGNKKRAVFDVYGGFGTGGFNTLDRSYYDNGNGTANTADYQLRSKFTRGFIQPSFGIVHPVVEAIFSTRFSVVNFYGLTAGNLARGADSTHTSTFYQIGNRPRLFYEPAITFRVGYKYVKFQMQLAAAACLNASPGTYYADYFQPVNLNLGASINIAKWYDSFRH
ncbi:hypothetical protein SAMN05444266_1064 [Chitinophaga jiangningensis]|uniref:Outer membrane protein beta-barrel domain-containing protein n=1 Tax=Chitinophaga jiangningensis TaxID=1419482 RepID=A0A1M7F6Y2_9BACT|nr:hypothetical protein [Chitinophaga jiangningensis]SHL99427.1 hypothetical protein SAMN05444266_1064 [Chitinophaga jiangningensis]